MAGHRECIRVVARVRPLGEREQALGEWETLIAQDGTIKIGGEEPSRSFLKSPSVRPSSAVRQFEFDGSFGSTATTREIYESTVKDIVLSSISGFNATVLLYGQTGSGKTHTLTGFAADHRSKSPLRRDGRSPIRRRQPRSESGAGLLQMAMREIFQEADRLLRDGQKLFVSLSCVEVYNESVYDLLRQGKSLEEPLAVSEDVGRGEFTVKGCRQEVVTSLAEAGDLLRRGDANRRFAETALNHHSSRGHMMFRLFFELVEETGPVCHSVCNFVDLAGSERLDRLENEDGSRLRAAEGKYINKSLFFLTQIIHQLSALHTPAHVPYRNSSLTKMLKNSIGGNAHTLIILCLNPAPKNLEQSVGTLRFGALARTIENIVERNVDFMQGEASIARLIAEFGEKISQMEKQLSQAGNKEPLLAHIRGLEEQQTFLQTQYNKLLCFNHQFLPKHASTAMRNTLHLYSCGVVESYTRDADHSRAAVFTVMSDRNLAAEIFERDVIRSLQSQLTRAKEEAQRVLEENHQLRTELYSANSQNILFRRLINVFINVDEGDHLLLGQDVQGALIENALSFIENCKNVQIQLSFPQHTKLPLKHKVTSPTLSVSLLMHKLDIPSRDHQSSQEPGGLSDYSLNSGNQPCDSALFSRCETTTSSELAMEKSSLISTTYMLHDTI